MKNKTNELFSSKQKRLAVDSAIGSVRLEGLEPPKNAKVLLNQYANGEITVEELQSKALEDVKNNPVLALI
jgi:hypothetical protein